MKALQKTIKQMASAALALIFLLALCVLPYHSVSSESSPQGSLIKALYTSQGLGAGSKLLRSAKDKADKRLNVVMGNLPLHFESNQGQLDSGVKFISRAAKYSVALSTSEATIRLHPSPSSGTRAMREGTKVKALARSIQPDQAESGSQLRMRLVGANPAAQLTGKEELPARTNYLLNASHDRWHTGITNYARVEQKHVYPGIDLVFYGNQQQLEYDFVVAPRARPDTITMVFDGANRMHLDSNGDLVINTPSGEVRQKKPFAYQEINGTRVETAARYVFKGKHRVGLRLGPYDRNRKLVIDPILDYSSFLGFQGLEPDIAIDASGNMYVAGTTSVDNLPVTPGAFGAVRKGTAHYPDDDAEDVFVLKLNREGNQVIYATYIGGIRSDHVQGMAADGQGNVYVTGWTRSVDFPTTPGAFKTILGSSCSGPTDGSCFDAFLIKLNPSGSGLVYSTFIGGSHVDIPEDVAVDSSLNAYVMGTTYSEDFPVTPGALQTSYRGAQDMFITKMNPQGSAPIYSTYLGGSSIESTSGLTVRAGMAVDSDGNAYVVGSTLSSDFPTTPGAFQTNLKGGGFVSKLNSSGTALIYSTYLRGGGCSAVAVDSEGNAYVTGVTASIDFPVKNAFQDANSVNPFIKSDSGGSRWTTMKRPPIIPEDSEPIIRSIAFAPNNANVIYVGTPNGIFKSTDSGESWGASGLGEHRVRRITIDERNPNTLYVGTLQFVTPNLRSSVFKSTDGGQTWSKILDAPAISDIVINPKDSSVVYASSERGFELGGEGVFKSTNEGKTWFNARAGGNVSEKIIYDLAVDPDRPSTLYAASAAGVFKTTDGGASWKKTPLGDKIFLAVEIDPSNSATVYASADEGDDDISIAVIDPDKRTNPRRRITALANDGRLFKSLDGGDNWQNISAGLGSDIYFNDIIIDRRATSTIYAVAKDGEGLYKTTNGGNDWTEINNFAGSVFVAAVDPQKSTLYAGIEGFSMDAFVTKLNPAGTDIIYSTYLGGALIDMGEAIAVDSEGNAFVAGETESKDFRITANAFDKQFFGIGRRLYYDAFVAKVSKTGELVFSSYLGGDHVEYPGGIVIGPDGTAYIAGVSGSKNLPLQNSLRPGPVSTETDVFVAKLRIPAASKTPVITNVSLSGKMLIVEGRNFEGGSVIIVDGKQQQTVSDPASATSKLMSKKAGKKIKKMPEAIVQVVNPDGGVSSDYVFIQP